MPTILLFAACEVVLWLAGIPPLSQTHDPFVGFSSSVPLMESTADGEGRRMVTTSPGKLTWFNPQSFPKEKPAGVRRVFCVGGSTTYGRPYWDATSYSAFLRKLLPIVDPAGRYEVINAGGISYASYRVASVMEELSRYEPDLFIVYSAHNEFLERRTYAPMFEQSVLRRSLTAALGRTRSWALLDRMMHASVSENEKSAKPGQLLSPEVDEMLNHSIGPTDYRRDDAWRQGVLRHYENNLKRMATIANNAGAELLFVTPAANEKDCAPFKSMPSELSQDALERKRRLVANAAMLAEQQHNRKAIELLIRASEIDPRDPALLYRKGRLEFAAGRHRDAQVSFREAIDQDVCPLRAVSEIAAAVNRVSRETGVPCVDFEKKLRTLSQRQLGHDCLGDEYFLDHVHPTVKVHGRLAVWMVEALQDHGWLGGTDVHASSLAGKIAKAEQEINARITPAVHGVALRNLAKVFHWSGKFSQAAVQARAALELLEDDQESRFILADCLAQLGLRKEALRQFDRLYDSLDAFPPGRIVYIELLLEEGRLEAAKTQAILALVDDESDPQVHFLLGLADLRLGEYSTAVDSLRKAKELTPENAEVLAALAEALAAAGAPEEAKRHYLLSLNYQPDSATTHHRLGLLYLRSGEVELAAEQFRQALVDDADYKPALDGVRISESLL